MTGRRTRTGPLSFPSAAPAPLGGLRAGTVVVIALLAVVLAACSGQPVYDVIVRSGTVYDGSGEVPFVGDVAISGDRVAAVGDLSGATATREVDATGMAVSPGFVNMLSWATESLIIDGRSLGDIRQGVTLEVFGEGSSLGPANDAMKEDFLDDFVATLGSREQAAATLGLAPDAELEVPWTTLGEYLQFLEDKGVATNVASFIGATTARVHEIGYEDRPPTGDEGECVTSFAWPWRRARSASARR